jgi:transcription antitermination factor NusG
MRDQRDTAFETSPAWYAIYTRHQHEKSIANMLTSKGFEVFLPLYEAGRQWKDRTKRLQLPLFPSYVFLLTCLDRRVEVLKTPGVCQFVGVTGVPSAVSMEEIESVRRAVDTQLRVEPHPFLKCGDRVRIKTGPLLGLEGILVRKKNLFRLVLSIELLNRALAMEVDVTTVEKIGSVSAFPLARTAQFNPVLSPARLPLQPFSVDQFKARVEG